MSLTILLPPDEEQKLAQRAAAIGQDVADYVHRLIKKDIELPSFTDLFAPVHQAVAQSKVGADELNSLLENAIADSRADRK